MRCKKARRLISDDINGNLDVKRKSALEKHIESCPDCQMVLEDMKGIVEKAHELEQISPSARTWPKIKARLDETRQITPPSSLKKKNFFHLEPKYAVAAALLLVVVISAVMLGIRYGKGIFGRMDPQQYTLSKLREAEHHYQMAIKALAEAAFLPKQVIDPEVSRIFQTNLEIIDASIAACKQAVLADPEDIEARDYLLFAYQKKLDLLDEMTAIKFAASSKMGANL